MSSEGLVFAVLAHQHPAALHELVDALRHTHPGCTVAVFNGGSDARLLHGLDVVPLPQSRPLRHGRLAAFHDAALSSAPAGDWLVCLDSDVLPLRAGLAEHLDGLACDYAAGHLSLVQDGTPWRPGREFLRTWSAWGSVLPVPDPWRCFNPVQCFSSRYVETYRAWPERADFLDRVLSSGVDAIEEIAWPTAGAALGLRLAGLGQDQAMRLRPPTPRELRDHLADPAVHFVHKVRTTPDALERQLLLAHLRSEAIDWERAEKQAARERRGPRARVDALRAAVALRRP